MPKPSPSRYVEAVIAIAISFCGFMWTVSHLRLYHDGSRLDRLGVFAAVLCITAAFAVSWGWLVSLVSRSFNWEPPACRAAALVILVPGFFVVAASDRLQAISLLLYLMTFAQLTAGRLAFPGKSDTEFREPSKPVTFSTK
jgi:uncharacterized membrane protein YjjP (DUF1212 family)